MRFDEQCKAAFYVRDTYRYTGRTKGGFEMHYRQERCSRRAKHGGLCTQHKKMVDSGRWLSMWK